jgi:hypothetical protein
MHTDVSFHLQRISFLWPIGMVTPKMPVVKRFIVIRVGLIEQVRLVAGSADHHCSSRFRCLVVGEKRAWRIDNYRGRRPGMWEPGGVLAIDTLHVF